ncbi:MAG: XTP/dITP diphosphatase [Acidilobaceae archaeon]|nr:XTP/dITP diphosphatase [Acidilobaceae archaeon]MCX8166190.1 XTP/dITP diphosphatase [Acidilobaceae archaeon]MDW7974828.1 XTP/dITP diphosphatase [Sulfolobales archaeon]
MGKRVAIVTANRAKGEEAKRILQGFGIEAEVVEMEKLEVQSEVLEEIALRAARAAFEVLKRPLVVDDSGLFVEALNGFPGPYSSYVFKKIGIRGILKLLEGEANRSAYFKTALAFVSRDVERVFVGVVRGRIAEEPRGSRGFGFDPIFVPEGEDRTFAEMESWEKDRISHRARAYEAFAKFF